MRIHPILHWTEADIWAYTRRENIPIIPLYLAREGKRYRSLGDADITNPVASTASNIEEILIELDGTALERLGPAERLARGLRVIPQDRRAEALVLGLPRLRRGMTAVIITPSVDRS